MSRLWQDPFRIDDCGLLIEKQKSTCPGNQKHFLESFFDRFFGANYCPLMFMEEK